MSNNGAQMPSSMSICSKMGVCLRNNACSCGVQNPITFSTQSVRHDAPAQERRGRLWRDVRLTRFAMREALEVAHDEDRTEVHSTLLASGHLRTLPSSYSLVEMIRAWATFRERDSMALTIHIFDAAAVVEGDAAHDLVAGRIDVPRLLAADNGRGTIEFWLEVVERNDNVSRLLTLEDAEMSVKDLLATLRIAGDRWTVDVEPRPCLGWRPWTLCDVHEWEGEFPDRAPLSLERIGVLHGSTMRLIESPIP